MKKLIIGKFAIYYDNDYSKWGIVHWLGPKVAANYTLGQLRALASDDIAHKKMDIKENLKRKKK